MTKIDHPVPEHAVAGTTPTTTPTTTARTTARTTATARSRLASARTAGILYLTIFVSGLFAELAVRSRLIERDDPAATAANILEAPGLFRLGVGADIVMLVADVAIAVVLFQLLRPINHALALFAAAFRITQTAVLSLNLLSMFQALRILDDADHLETFGTHRVEALAMLSLDSHRYGYILGLTFFGFATIAIGAIAWSSTRMPSALGVVLMLAGAGYLADMAMFFMIPGYDGAASAIVLAPALLGELWFSLWLLTKGRVLERPDEIEPPGIRPAVGA
jgi:hypothetical protein